MGKARSIGNSVVWLGLLAGVLTGASASAQPARAQTPPDISGEWRLENHEEDTTAQPPLGDYLGIPFNDAGQMRADTSAESIWGMPEYRCRTPHQWRGLGGVRILKEQDPLTREVAAYHIQFMRPLEITSSTSRSASIARRAEPGSYPAAAGSRIRRTWRRIGICSP